MTDAERLKALRGQFSRERAILERSRCSKSEPAYWLFNALVFDWYLTPTAFAINSFQYAMRQHEQRPAKWFPA